MNEELNKKRWKTNNFSLFAFYFSLFIVPLHRFSQHSDKVRGVAQLVAHLVWDQVVARSSRVTPTFFIARNKQIQMEDIGIYRSIRKNAVLLVFGFLWIVCTIGELATVLIFTIVDERKSFIEYWKEFFSKYFDDMGVFMGSVILITCVPAIFFITYFYFRWAYRFLRDRIRHIPYYIITDKSFIINRPGGLEFSFADIETFVFKSEKVKRDTSKWIEIQYKNGVDLEKYDEVTCIETQGLTVSPENLCDLLNERLAASKPLINKHKYTC